MRKATNPEALFEKYINTHGKNLRILGNFDKTKYATIADEELAKMTPAERKKFTAESDAFFANSRRHGLDGSVELAVGGSDMGIINGFGYLGATPSKLYMQKAFGVNYPIPAKTQEIFDTGHRAEEYIAESFELATGLPVFHWPLQVVNEKYPHCIANIDGIIIEGDKENKKIGIYEGKCLQQYESQKNWKAMAQAENCADNADLVPIAYRLQVWYYLAVYELDFAYICGGGWGFSFRDIGYCRLERLPPEEEKDLMENAEAFITEHCLKRIRPSDIDVVRKESIIKAYGDIYSEMTISKKPVELDPKYIKTFERALECKKQVNAHENELREIRKRKKSIENEYYSCLSMISEACFGSYQGIIKHDGNEYTIYASMGKPKTPIDVDQLEREFPEEFKKYKRPAIKVDIDRLKAECPSVYEKVRRDSTRSLCYSLVEKKKN